ncbi:MAG: hypothetical protein ATN35_11675 [Epulopiscium sp. Nele67-Bin004]|nr:MAG: hypothetical protein ATN35_11675 [Epulopiscium sp. Nele67-Bin004]
MRAIHTGYLREGSTLALAVLGDQCETIASQGQDLTKGDILLLKENNISHVYIKDEYCFYEDQMSYTAASENIYYKIMTLKNIAQLSAAGTATREVVTETIGMVNDIVKILMKHLDEYYIRYEPTKITTNDFEERTIYVSMMSALLALKLGYNKREAAAVCLGYKTVIANL